MPQQAAFLSDSSREAGPNTCQGAGTTNPDSRPASRRNVGHGPRTPGERQWETLMPSLRTAGAAVEREDVAMEKRPVDASGRQQVIADEGMT